MVSKKKIPSVSVSAYGDFSITYKVLLFGDNAGNAFDALEEMKSRVWYVARRNGLTMPYPIYETIPKIPKSLEVLEEQKNSTVSVVKNMSGFASLRPDVLETMLKGSEVRDYATNEMVLYQDEALLGLYLILKGSVKLTFSDTKLRRLVSLGELTEGEFFGEKASLLSDRTSDVLVQAIVDLRVLLVPTETLQIVLAKSPRLSQEIGEVMELRRRMLKLASSDV